MPYCDVPCAIAPGIRCVLSLSTMQSLMNGVAISTSTPGQRPVPSLLRDQALGDRGLQHRGELQADLLLLVRREHRDDAVDGFGRVERVQRREHQVAGLGGVQRRLDRFHVAHFADEDDVGVLAQGAAQRVGERSRVDADLALVDDALVVAVQVFDRVLDGDDVRGAVGVDVVDHRRERRGLAAAGRAGDEHEAALFVRRSS